MTLEITSDRLKLLKILNTNVNFNFNDESHSGSSSDDGSSSDSSSDDSSSSGTCSECSSNYKIQITVLAGFPGCVILGVCWSPLCVEKCYVKLQKSTDFNTIQCFKMPLQHLNSEKKIFSKISRSVCCLTCGSRSKCVC